MQLRFNRSSSVPSALRLIGVPQRPKLYDAHILRPLQTQAVSMICCCSRTPHSSSPRNPSFIIHTHSPSGPSPIPRHGTALLSSVSTVWRLILIGQVASGQWMPTQHVNVPSSRCVLKKSEYPSRRSAILSLTLYRSPMLCIYEVPLTTRSDIMSPSPLPPVLLSEHSMPLCEPMDHYLDLAVCGRVVAAVYSSSCTPTGDTREVDGYHVILVHAGTGAEVWLHPCFDNMVRSV